MWEILEDHIPCCSFFGNRGYKIWEWSLGSQKGVRFRAV